MKKRTVWLIVLIIVLLATGGLAYRAMASNRAATTNDVQTASVQLGTLTATLDSAGTARSAQSATINWETSGRVGAITLKQGDPVKAGQELAAIDPTTLPSSVSSAQQNLIDAQQAMDDLLHSQTNIATAQQAVVDAQTTLDDLKASTGQDIGQAQLDLVNAQQALVDAQKNRQKMDYPHTTDQLVIQKAQAEYLLDKQATKDAQKAFDKVSHKKLTDPDRVNALNNLVNAQQKEAKALATYNWYILGYSDADKAQADAEVAAAQSALDKAQANYDTIKSGATPAAVALAEAKLADAQRAYDRVKNGPTQADIAAAQAKIDAAQETLDQAHLLAPFAGTITEVDVSTGDLVDQGQTAFRIDDLSSIYVDLQISEVDIQSLQIGQKVALTFDAIPDKTYNGVVSQIGIVGTVSQGVVNYPVTVRMTDADASVRPGMTAAVSIITNQHANVLMVPNQAVRNLSGQSTVTVLFEGQQISVPVTVGLTNDTMTEVSSDQLRQGDEVVLNVSSTSSSGLQNRSFGGGFGGPGVFFRGGQ